MPSRYPRPRPTALVGRLTSGVTATWRRRQPNASLRDGVRDTPLRFEGNPSP